MKLLQLIATAATLSQTTAVSVSSDVSTTSVDLIAEIDDFISYVMPNSNLESARSDLGTIGWCLQSQDDVANVPSWLPQTCAEKFATIERTIQ